MRRIDIREMKKHDIERLEQDLVRITMRRTRAAKSSLPIAIC